MSATLDAYPSLRTVLSSKQDPDPYNRPFSQSSPIWTVYADEAKKADEALVNEWNRGLDTLALFAGLFSAVTSAFILESYTLMQPDFTELTFRVLSANVSGQNFLNQPFVIPASIRAVNCLWLVSLILSLSAALIAIMGKDWIAAYRTPAKQRAHEWAQLRQFRCDAVRNWKMAEVIALAPILLHMSLLLFLLGLGLFLLPVDTITSSIVWGLSSIVVIFYGVTFCSPLLYSSSPFRSAITPAMHKIMRRLRLWVLGSSPDHMPRFRSGSVRTIDVRAWISRLHSFRVHSPSLILYISLGFHSTVRRVRGIFVSIRSCGSHLRSAAKLPSLLFSHLANSNVSDLWHDLPDEKPIAIITAEVISWLSESPPTLPCFQAIVHALKDAECGKQISTYATSDVRTWFLTGTNLMNPEAIPISDVARIYIAGLNLDLHRDAVFQAYSDRLDSCLRESASAWPEDLLIAFCQPGKSPSPRKSLHRPTLLRVLDHLQHDTGLASQQRVATLITLLQYLSLYSVFGDVKSQVAELFNKDTYTSRETFHCQRNICVMINYLCVYLRNPSRFGLESGVVLSARKTLLTLLSDHDQECYGIPLLAHLFAFPGRSHPVWTGQYWRFDDVYAIVRRIPESTISSTDENEPNNPALDEAIAITLSRFMAHSQPWTASDEAAVAQRCCCIMRSFIPPTSISRASGQRACKLLSVMLRNSALCALTKSVLLVWLLRDIAVLVIDEKQFDPASEDAGILCDELLESNTASADEDGGGPRWCLAETLPNLLMANIRCGISLLEALSQLRKIFPDHEAWDKIERSAQEFGGLQPPEWAGFAARNFWDDMGFMARSQNARESISSIIVETNHRGSFLEQQA